WGTLWDQTRDGVFPASRFVDIVLAHIEHETASTTLRTLLQQLVLASSSYVARDRRDDTLERVAEKLWLLASTAEAGPDRQFQFGKVFAQLAATEAQLDTVGSLRDGSITLQGLKIDTDLGWELLIALAAGGRAGAADIEQALTDDRTASGEQSAARA